MQDIYVYDPENCMLCPRRCRANRLAGRKGACSAGNEIKIARAENHFWEEPCISGTRGSGAIFFSGCSLCCTYCQNYEISHNYDGAVITPERFSEICFELKEKGAHNINLVTADHFVPYIRDVLLSIKKELAIPIVYNCSGYQSREILSLLDGLVDIYLVDFKYLYDDGAEKYSRAKGYGAIALEAIGEMLRQVGSAIYDDEGLMKSGVIVRHMVLPGHSNESVAIIKALSESFGTDGYKLSLMSQYTPNGEEGAPKRRITSFEYKRALDTAEELGFDAYMQMPSSADSAYTPDFDLTGVYKP